MDVRHLAFEDESFDVAIDKGKSAPLSNQNKVKQLNLGRCGRHHGCNDDR